MRDATRPGQPPVGAGTEGSALKTLHVHATGNQTLRAPVRALAGGRRRVPGRLRWRFRVRRTGGGRRGPRRARGIRLQPRGRPWPERVGRAGGWRGTGGLAGAGPRLRLRPAGWPLWTFHLLAPPPAPALVTTGVLSSSSWKRVPLDFGSRAELGRTHSEQPTN
jgi:hypothetical protein